jgi:hypothetical protein
MIHWITFDNPAELFAALDEAVRSLDVPMTEKELEKSQVKISDRSKSKSKCSLKVSTKILFDSLSDTSDLRSKIFTKEEPGFKSNTHSLSKMYLLAALKRSKRKVKRGICYVDTVDPDGAKYRNLIRRASVLQGYSLEYIKIFDDGTGGSFYKGIRFESRLQNCAELPNKLAGCNVYELCGEEGNICIPVNFKSTVVERHPYLLPNISSEEILIWNGTPKKGEWQRAKKTTSPLASIVEIKIPKPDHTFQAYDKNDITVQSKLIKEFGTSRHRRMFEQNVIECVKTSNRSTSPELLNILDYLEAGQIEDASYYSMRDGDNSSPFARISHYVGYREDMRKSRKKFGIEKYIQPHSFAELGIPIYIAQGYRFMPDIANLVVGLKPDHPLLKQLLSYVDKKETGVVYLTNMPKENSPTRIFALENPKPLHACIDRIDVLQESLSPTRAKEFEEFILECIKSAEMNRDKITKKLEQVCTEEEKFLKQELADALSKISSLLKETKANGEALEKKQITIRSFCNEITKSVTVDASEAWIKLLTCIDQCRTDLNNDRSKWLNEQQNALTKVDRLASQRRSELGVLFDTLEPLLKTLSSHLTQCKTHLQTLNEMRSRVDLFKAEYEETQSSARVASEDTEKSLAGWEIRLIAKRTEIDSTFEQLVAEDSKLQVKQDRLDKDSEEIRQEEVRLAKWRMEQEQQVSSNINRIAASKAEEKELERLRDEVIPKQQIDLAKFESAIALLAVHNYPEQNSVLRSKIADASRKKQNDEAAKSSVLVNTRSLNETLADLARTKRLLQESIEEYESAQREIPGLTKNIGELEKTISLHDKRYSGDNVISLRAKEKELEQLIKIKKEEERQLHENYSKIKNLRKKLKEIKMNSDSGEDVCTEAKMLLQKTSVFRDQICGKRGWLQKLLS